MIKKVLLITLIIFGVVWSSFVFLNKKQEKDKFVFWTIQLKGVADDLVEDNIKIFKNKHPELDVVWIDIPIAETQKRILASTLSSTPPDLVNLNPDFSSVLARVDALEFIDEKELKIYNQEILNILKYKNKVFGIPFYATSPVTMYNKAEFEKYGVKNVPKTYEELFKISNKFKNSGKYSLSINLNENDTFSKILNKYDVYSSETFERKSFYPIKLFKDFYDCGYISKESLTLNHREIVEKYMAENALSMVVGTNFIKMVKENALNTYNKSEVAPQLTGSNKKYDVAIMNFVIPKKAKHKELALEFALQITNRENQLQLAKMTNVLPANQKALEDRYFKINKSTDLLDKARIISASQLNNLQSNDFGYDNKKTINDIINKTLENCLILNKDIKKEINLASKQIKVMERK